MRTFTRLAIVLAVAVTGLATSGAAGAREVDADSSLEAPPPAHSDKARPKESTVSAKYDASFPVRDVTRAKQPRSI
ncbi:MAG: hypothetical protein ABI321_12245 [Polyangia bacterium]